MTKDKELLDMIDDEGPDMEEIEMEKADFDPVKKIAAVMERSRPRQDILDIDAGTLDQRLAAAFLIENLTAGTVRPQLDDTQYGLQKLAVMDAAYEFTNKTRYQETELGELAVTTAGDIYHNMFSTLCNMIYIQGEARKTKKRKEEMEQMTESYQDAFHRFRPSEPGQLVAANRLVALVGDNTECLKHAGSPHDIKYLIAMDTYTSMLKNPEIKEDVRRRLGENENQFKDLYVYTVLKLHQDFFKEMERL